MSFLAQTILQYILLYKYWALFLVTFIASLAIPVPAGLLLVASAAFASQGYFNIVLVLIVVIIANILGDTICYWVARLYGRRFLYRIGLRKIMESKNFKLIETQVKKRPGFIIFASRFEAFATLSVNLLCGLSGVSYGRFALFEAMGAFVDAFLYGMVGYIFASNWQAVNTLLGRILLVVFLLIVIGIGLFSKKKIQHLLSKRSDY